MIPHPKKTKPSEIPDSIFSLPIKLCSVILTMKSFRHIEYRKGGNTMPLIYETTARIAEDGNFQIELKDFDFVKGMNFLVKLIPQPKFDPKKFKKNMQSMIDRFAENNPCKDMTKEQILADLRRQREEMYAEAV